MLAKYIGIAYIIYMISVIFYEFLHFIAAVTLHIEIININIGNFIYFHINKVFISPFIFSGFVDVEYKSLISKNSLSICIFYLSGIIGNLLIFILSLFFIDNLLLKIWAVVVNGLSIAFSVIPITEGNDVVMLFYSLKEKQKND